MLRRQLSRSSLQDVSNKVCSTEGCAVTPRGTSFKVEQTSVAARAESEWNLWWHHWTTDPVSHCIAGLLILWNYTFLHCLSRFELGFSMTCNTKPPNGFNLLCQAQCQALGAQSVRQSSLSVEGEGLASKRNISILSVQRYQYAQKSMGTTGSKAPPYLGDQRVLPRGCGMSAQNWRMNGNLLEEGDVL